MIHKPTTLGELRSSAWRSRSVKQELRENLIAKLRTQEPLFPGIIGYDDSVIPALVNAILAQHDILLLGLRGQAKTRLVRQLHTLLDEWTPIVRGSEINDNPFSPISAFAKEQILHHGEETPIAWIHRSERYAEKLATPDVTIADLIGDIDPIKAANLRLSFSSEGAIHYGLIPRANRGIFAINELPDLQARIQVGLFNIMEEKDVQIRGFNLRIPLDIMLVFTANPEDYTNRGSIITPLKDRIDSQILTHYPKNLEDGISITAQEAWTRRSEIEPYIPQYFREIVEHIALEARASEYVDQKSGVSARMTISALEQLVSNAERRAIINAEPEISLRISDITRILPAITGKVELVFEGEQEGATKVAKALIGKAVRAVFLKYFPNPLEKKDKRSERAKAASERRGESKGGEQFYREIVRWFEGGKGIELHDTMTNADYERALAQVAGLRDVAVKYLRLDEETRSAVVASAMEFVLDGLHQCSKIAKDELEPRTTYKDMVGALFSGSRGNFQFDEDEDEEM